MNLALPRCIYCRHLIWPWQKEGFRIIGRLILFWHPACYRASREIEDENRTIM